MDMQRHQSSGPQPITPSPNGVPAVIKVLHCQDARMSSSGVARHGWQRLPGVWWRLIG